MRQVPLYIHTLVKNEQRDGAKTRVHVLILGSQYIKAGKTYRSISFKKVELGVFSASTRYQVIKRYSNGFDIFQGIKFLNLTFFFFTEREQQRLKRNDSYFLYQVLRISTFTPPCCSKKCNFYRLKMIGYFLFITHVVFSAMVQGR